MCRVLKLNGSLTLKRQIPRGDITYVRTYEGFLYVGTVIDLFSRRVVGWSMDKHLVISALLMAVYQRRPKEKVLVHSDQGSQYGSSDYLAFMKEHNLILSRCFTIQKSVILMKLKKLNKVKFG